jgi:hypothetical protein
MALDAFVQRIAMHRNANVHLNLQNLAYVHLNMQNLAYLHLNIQNPSSVYGCAYMYTLQWFKYNCGPRNIVSLIALHILCKKLNTERRRTTRFIPIQMSSQSLPALMQEELSDRLLLAVPKKGRLHEKCLQLLEGADIQFRRKNRLDIALSTNLPVAIIFLPASDIPQFVGAGDVDLGITGYWNMGLNLHDVDLILGIRALLS